jgi:hypothetical protein
MKHALKWFFSNVVLTWHFVALFAMTLLLFLVMTNKVNLNKIKAGTVEISFEQKTKDLNAYNTPEFKNLKSLNEAQLKLFLIMGGEDAAYYRFTNVALKGDASKEQFMKLNDAHLLTYQKGNGDTTIIRPTKIGALLHKALIQSIYSEMIK